MLKINKNHLKNVYFFLSRVFILKGVLKAVEPFIFNRYYQYQKKQLDRISPSFCKAKWLNSTVHIQQGHTQSCHHTPAHLVETKKDGRVDFHNTNRKRVDRKMMKDGTYPSSCDYCWKLKDHGEKTDRLFKSSEDWAEVSVDRFDEIESPNPTYLEVSFDNKCQLKCAYCNPLYSSSIYKDFEQNGPLIGFEGFEYKDKIVPSKDNPYLDAFWDWFLTVQKEIRVLRITGGEPFISKEFYKLIDHLGSDKSLSLRRFIINSNFSFPLNLIEDVQPKLDKIKKICSDITFSVSLDTVGPPGEYLRDGLSVETLKTNVKYVLDRGYKVLFLSTFHLFCLENFCDYLAYILDLKKIYGSQNVTLGVTLLRYPSFFSYKVFNKDEKQFFSQAICFMKANQGYNGFSIEEVRRFVRLETVINKNIIDVKLREKLVEFISDYDERRSKKYSEVFSHINL